MRDASEREAAERLIHAVGDGLKHLQIDFANDEHAQSFVESQCLLTCAGLESLGLSSHMCKGDTTSQMIALLLQPPSSRHLQRLTLLATHYLANGTVDFDHLRRIDTILAQDKLQMVELFVHLIPPASHAEQSIRTETQLGQEMASLLPTLFRRGVQITIKMHYRYGSYGQQYSSPE
ncbi:hypothetical protein SCP_0504920 [Sparassis crispa]|uniref:Uncharacterized protein n=1 Tax=Sparassis crispa TaxID=139825 RepID=A0A401GMK2_9APHY|nr:hypothetical protein SCP_0504920 [Sparassis crispa]GBE83443.1 hypothetical protein SCP_0504920 [Sparassis crispa]